MYKAYKMLFSSTIILSTLISVCSYSWLGMWLGLEINLLSIIPLMTSKKNIMSAESAMKYFIVQAIASTIIMMTIIAMMTWSNTPSALKINSLAILAMNSALIMKMGMAPFHFWFPEVMEGLNWINCLLVLTWQKLAPLGLLMYNVTFNLFLMTIIIMSMIVSGVMGVNQISLRKILAYSSINHMGWMISSLMLSQSIWIMYFLVYSLITINLVMIFKTLKTMFLAQLYQALNNQSMMKTLFMMNFLSLSGIPPFLGFLPKWLTIQALLDNKMMLLPTIMIIFTIIMVYVYIQITLTTLVMNTNELNWDQPMEKETFKNYTLSMFNFLTIASLIVVTFTMNML